MLAAVLSPGGEQSRLAGVVIGAAAEIEGFGADVAATLEWCRHVGLIAPVAGAGATRELWELLAATASVSVSAARMLEPHLDALGILSEAEAETSASHDPRDLDSIHVSDASTWGVFAAEGAGTRLRATWTTDGWILDGTKPWCSLAADLSHALVTAFVDDSERGLFAVDLRVPGVDPHRGEWFARGLPHVASSPVDFSRAPAVAVGETGWYLSRPGFARGGMSVAACWWGAAVGIAGALVGPAASERADQLAFVHLGRADAALWAARAALAEAAAVIDAAGAPGSSGAPRAVRGGGAASRVDERLLGDRVRTIVVDAATLVLAEADAALGPAPLVADEAHAARVADLHLYLRQHHGLRDVARIGRALAAADS
jgi:hypothetical protein